MQQFILILKLQAAHESVLPKPLPVLLMVKHFVLEAQSPNYTLQAYILSSISP